MQKEMLQESLFVGVLMGVCLCAFASHPPGCYQPDKNPGTSYYPSLHHYHVGMKVTYFCTHKNYKVVDGRTERECLASGRWSRYTPLCFLPVTCRHRNPPKDGNYVVSQLTKTTWAKGEIAQFQCDSGTKLSGSRKSTCGIYGFWSSPVPSCNPEHDFVRDVPLCIRPPNPQFGKVVSIPPSSKNTFTEGEYIQYVCESGYKVDGDGKVGCFDGRWNYVPQCRFLNTVSHSHSDVTCPHRPAPVNGEYIQDKHKTTWRPGDIARYRCVPNYFLIGHDYTDCRDDGTWRFHVPKCIRGCKRPLDLEFGSVESVPKGKAMFEPGEVITYRCYSGYKLQGESKVYCQNKGWASTPTCKKEVTCRHRLAPANGVYIQDVDKRQWYVGDIARYRCNQGYIMNGHSYVDCLSDGSWRFHVPTCRRSDNGH